MRNELCLIGLLLINPLPLPGQEKAPNEIGEALPSGAIGRVGSARFRVTGPVVGVRFVDDKKLLVRVYQQPEWSFNDGKGDFLILDMDSGLEQSRLAWELHRFLGHGTTSGPVREFISFPRWSVSPNAALLATGDYHRAIEVRELATGKSVFRFRDDDAYFPFVQFTPDGKRVTALAVQHYASDKQDKQPLVAIRMWDLESRKEVHKFLPSPGVTETFQAHWFMFSPDGAFLAASGYEDGKSGVVRVWDTAGKNPSWLVPGQTPSRKQTRAIAISPDSKTLASVHDGRIKLWDLGSHKEVKDLAEFTGRCATLDFSPNGKLLIAGAGKEQSNRLRLWNLASGAEIVLPLNESPAYVFSSDERSLVLADTANGNLIVCDTATGKVK
jgi:WD40 repeat protein